MMQDTKAQTFNQRTYHKAGVTVSGSSSFQGAGKLNLQQPTTVVFDTTSVAVADSMTLPVLSNVINFTGTGKATYIQPTTNGRIIWCISTTTDTLVDGSNLKLAGNFNGTANDIITLIYWAGNYYEICRAVN
jgi:hypothetical protein